MGRRSEESREGVFFLYLIIFCFTSWAIWSHYRTINGPTALATVVSKDARWHKNSYDYFLNIQFVHDGLQVATSSLEVREANYPEFEPGDTFPVKYAKSVPEETAFVGEQFYSQPITIIYCVLVLILAFSGRGLYRKYWRSNGRRTTKARPANSPPEITPPARYSAAKTLAWATAGAIVFSAGIVSCRHAANFMKAPGEVTAYQYMQATLLKVHYSPTTNYTSALVRLPDSATTGAPVRMSLSPQQYALLCARLSRPHPQHLQLLVAYAPTTPNQVALADAELPALEQAETEETPLGINSNTLGILLSIIGVALVARNLIKYVRHTNA